MQALCLTGEYPVMEGMSHLWNINQLKNLCRHEAWKWPTCSPWVQVHSRLAFQESTNILYLENMSGSFGRIVMLEALLQWWMKSLVAAVVSVG